MTTPSARAEIITRRVIVCAEPCGGCGQTDPDKRCIGCMHVFKDKESK